MANHASTRTTQLYDRRRDELSLDEVERIVIQDKRVDTAHANKHYLPRVLNGCRRICGFPC